MRWFMCVLVLVGILVVTQLRMHNSVKPITPQHRPIARIEQEPGIPGPPIGLIVTDSAGKSLSFNKKLGAFHSPIGKEALVGIISTKKNIRYFMEYQTEKDIPTVMPMRGNGISVKRGEAGPCIVRIMDDKSCDEALDGIKSNRKFKAGDGRIDSTVVILYGDQLEACGANTI